jgi:hypothetical protein
MGQEAEGRDVTSAARTIGDRYQDEFGLRYGELSVVVAVVAHWRVYGMPCDRSDVYGMLGKVESFLDIGGAMTRMERRGLLATAATYKSSRLLYKPTNRALSKVKGWQQGAAESRQQESNAAP